MKKWLVTEWARINHSRIIYAGFMTFAMTLFMYIVFYSWFGFFISDNFQLQMLMWFGFPMFFAPLMFCMHLLTWHPLSEKFIKREIKECPECNSFGYFKIICKHCHGDGYVENNSSM